MSESRRKDPQTSADRSPEASADQSPGSAPIPLPPEETASSGGVRSPSKVRVTLLWFTGFSAVLAILVPSGSDAYSAGAWDDFLLTTFRHLTAAQVDAIVVAVRKSIHFFGYGTLAWIWAAALAGTALWRQSAEVRHGGRPRDSPTERGPAPPPEGPMLQQPALTLAAGVIAFFVAAADEWNQTRFAERTGSVEDVVLDVAGIVAFLTVRHWLLTRPDRRRRLNRRTERGA